jgi:hypothetical protein
VHQYLDVDSSGTHPDCVPAATVPQALRWANFTEWVHKYRVPVFLTEFGAANNSNCQAGLGSLLSLLDSAPYSAATGGFLGWTAWSAGHAWGSRYFMGLNPGDEVSSLMVSVYAQHLTPPNCSGFLLGFLNAPVNISTGYSLQAHNPAWSSKYTLLTQSEAFASPALVCIDASQESDNQVALYDQHGTQFTCTATIQRAQPLFDLSTCSHPTDAPMRS